VATHGRALWILDHLEPIQEYAAVQAADAKLFSVPTALQWKSKDDRNDEFWGHQFFAGENPPVDAVIQYHLRRQANDVRLRISDASGRQVRELTAPQNRRTTGIQTVCWDQRVEPIEAEAPPAIAQQGAAGRGGAAGGAGGAGAAGGRGGAGAAGGEGRGGGGGGRGANIPGVPTPLPTSGYMPSNPCAGGGGFGGGGGGRGGGGGGAAGPLVLPGTYNVALVVDGSSVDAKPMRIIMDPAVQLAEAQHRRYTEILTDLHELQRRGTRVAGALNALYPQMTDAAQRVSSATNIPANVKSQFDALNTEFNAVRVKFGVPSGPAAGGGRGGRGGGGGGGGGGRGGGGADAAANVLGRTGALKGSIMSIWETPSGALLRQYDEVRPALLAAMTEANGFLGRAATVSQALRPHGITLTVPAAVE
jgi:hypothetical protein